MLWSRSIDTVFLHAGDVQGDTAVVTQGTTQLIPTVPHLPGAPALATGAAEGLAEDALLFLFLSLTGALRGLGPCTFGYPSIGLA